MQADWVSFLSPSMLTHFPYHHFTEVTLTKGNHVKLTREFCGLNYLNSPELLYHQLASVLSGSAFECFSRNVCLTMQLLEFSLSCHHREDHAMTWMLCGAQLCFLVSRHPSRLPGRPWNARGVGLGPSEVTLVFVAIVGFVHPLTKIRVRLCVVPVLPQALNGFLTWCGQILKPSLVCLSCPSRHVEHPKTTNCSVSTVASDCPSVLSFTVTV